MSKIPLILVVAAAAHGAPQELTPTRQIEMYLDGYHIYQDEMGLPAERQRQVRVAHYCHHATAELVQCALYDGNGKDARLIGIEYVIPDPVFKALPAAEQRLWHPHDGEVDSGLLVAPGLPAATQNKLLGDLRSTHGKTWHVWQVDRDKFPLGEPRLMWAVDPRQLNARTRASLQQRKQDPHF